MLKFKEDCCVFAFGMGLQLLLWCSLGLVVVQNAYSFNQMVKISNSKEENEKLLKASLDLAFKDTLICR